MVTYTQILYHIIFSTIKRENVLVEHNLEKLFGFIWDILKEKECKLYRINGYKNHVHMLIRLNPLYSLNDLMNEIKSKSAAWNRKQRLFPIFSAWESGYTAVTCNINDKNKIIQFIRNQKELHESISFREELLKILKANKIDYTEKILD